MRLEIHHRPCLPIGQCLSLIHILFNEYMNLSLRYPPRFTQVSTEEAAWKQLENTKFDLVICKMCIRDRVVDEERVGSYTCE